ncbi:MAG: hypothetical protein C7B45_15935 [Sulfobacillus acidophilus]|uniref:Histidine phosphatase family protein n=1 Tax=Sulfobacillus acidophilus TaxID=53633 RepID=A0A2T2WDB0_9FIRM|nr:MAG: hypothetical protein C7B45_15935 [Sulfobacillus acidophilus]
MIEPPCLQQDWGYAVRIVSMLLSSAFGGDGITKKVGVGGVRVLIVRHGESEANRENRIVSYRGDPGLTDLGRQEAQHVAQMWSKAPIEAIYTSALRRTQQTAVAFVRPGVKIQLDERLHEIGLGRWDGQVIADIERAEADRYRRWKEDPEIGAPEGGELLSQVAGRMHEFLDDVRRWHPQGLVVAVSHSDCMKAVMLSVLAAPWQSAQWVHLSNTAGIVLEWRNTHWQLMTQPAMPPG